MTIGNPFDAPDNQGVKNSVKRLVIAGIIYIFRKTFCVFYIKVCRICAVPVLQSLSNKMKNKTLFAAFFWMLPFCCNMHTAKLWRFGWVTHAVFEHSGWFMSSPVSSRMGDHTSPFFGKLLGPAEFALVCVLLSVVIGCNCAEFLCLSCHC